jgi:hypothetical protein
MRTFNWTQWIAFMVATALLVAVPETVPFVETPTAQAEEDDGAGDRYYDAAVRYIKKRKPLKALEFFEKALPYMRDDSGIYYNLVMVAEGTYEFEKLMLYGAAFTFLEPDSADSVEIRRKMKRVTELMRKRQLKLASIDFRVKPKGVDIYVNGVPVTRSGGPAVQLPFGEYTASAVLEDHNDWQQVFTAKKGESQTIKGSMVKKIYFGMLNVVTDPPEGVDVMIDGKKVGVTPLKPKRLQTGRYLVRFEKDGWDYWHRYVDITRDGTYELTPTMERLQAGSREQ